MGITDTPMWVEFRCICYPRAGISWRGGCLAQRWCSGALRFASPLVAVHHHMLCAGTRGWIVTNITALSDCLTLSYISRQIKVKRTVQTAQGCGIVNFVGGEIKQAVGPDLWFSDSRWSELSKPISVFILKHDRSSLLQRQLLPLAQSSLSLTKCKTFATKLLIHRQRIILWKKGCGVNFMVFLFRVSQSFPEVTRPEAGKHWVDNGSPSKGQKST